MGGDKSVWPDDDILPRGFLKPLDDESSTSFSLNTGDSGELFCDAADTELRAFRLDASLFKLCSDNEKPGMCIRRDGDVCLRIASAGGTSPASLPLSRRPVSMPMNALKRDFDPCFSGDFCGDADAEGRLLPWLEKMTGIWCDPTVLALLGRRRAASADIADCRPMLSVSDTSDSVA